MDQVDTILVWLDCVLVFFRILSNVPYICSSFENIFGKKSNDISIGCDVDNIIYLYLYLGNRSKSLTQIYLFEILVTNSNCTWRKMILFSMDTQHWFYN